MSTVTGPERDEAVDQLLARLPPVETNALSAARVWRRLAESPRRSVPRWMVVATCMAAAVIIALPAAWRTPSSAGEIVLSSGGVYFSLPTQPWAPGSSGQSVAAGERIRSNSTGQALLRIDGVSAVLVDRATDVAFEQIAHGTVLRLARGRITARVSKRPAGEPFIVQTDEYTVRVVGTLFSVEQTAAAGTVVSVREGTVEVVQDDRVVARVTAGERWCPADTGRKTADETSDIAASILEDGLAHRSVDKLLGRFDAMTRPVSIPDLPSAVLDLLKKDHVPPPTTRAPDPGAVPHETITTAVRRPVSEPAPTPAPLQPEAAIAPPPIVVRLEPIAPAPSPPVATMPAEFAQLPPPILEIVPPTPKPAPTPAPTSPMQSAFAHAQELLAKGEYPAAADAFERAVSDDPSRAESALYQLGRVSMTKLNDFNRAPNAFQNYRARYPRGTFAPEVEVSTLEIDLKLGRADDAVAQATIFLGEHPEDERAQGVFLTRANLLRDRGDYADALIDYRAVTKPALADDAMFSTAYCQRKLGDRAGAVATLNHYLAQFPDGKHRADAQTALSDR